MSALGIPVTTLTVTFHSGRVGTWDDIRIDHDPTRLILLLGPRTVEIIPWSAIETARWTLPERAEG